MPDTERSHPAAPADEVRRLSSELALEPSALGEALFVLAAQLRGGLSVKDAVTGRYRYVNEPLARMFGRAPADMLGRIDAELIDAAAWVPLQAAEQRAASTDGPQVHRHRIDLGGRMREFDVTRLRLAAAAPGPVLALWIERTEQRDRERSLRDALRQLEQRTAAEAAAVTGARPAAPPLPQPRAEFDDQLRRELDLSEREHREFALVSVQVDEQADGGAAPAPGAAPAAPVEQALRRLVTRNTRAMDGSCRLAEGRWAILLSGVGLATAHARAEDLRRQCATEIVAHEGQALRFTVSMGVASYPHTAVDRAALVQASEMALARARDRGGNAVALAGIRFEARRDG